MRMEAIKVHVLHAFYLLNWVGKGCKRGGRRLQMSSKKLEGDGNLRVGEEEESIGLQERNWIVHRT